MTTVLLELARRGTERERDTVLRMRAAGASYREIQRAVGLSRMTALRYCREVRLAPPPVSAHDRAVAAAKADLDRAYSRFDRQQNPANWAALVDARRAYEDKRKEGRRW
jgi:hypothetical protein